MAGCGQVGIQRIQRVESVIQPGTYPPITTRSTARAGGEGLIWTFAPANRSEPHADRSGVWMLAKAGSRSGLRRNDRDGSKAGIFRGPSRDKVVDIRICRSIDIFGSIQRLARSQQKAQHSNQGQPIQNRYLSTTGTAGDEANAAALGERHPPNPAQTQASDPFKIL